MIYDCFTFLNELDLLEMRLNILSDIVDHFVIVESNKTFTNIDKEFIYEKNMKRFLKHQNKIIYIKVKDMPNGRKRSLDRKKDCNWKRERHQRNCIKRGLFSLKEDDVVFIGDADEIPNPETISKMLKNFDIKKTYGFNQKWFHYFLNLQLNVIWPIGTKMISGHLYHKKYKQLAQNVRIADTDIQVDEGGWHFSYLGDKEFIKTKLKSFSHQELNTTEIINKLEEIIYNNKILWHSNDEYTLQKVLMTDDSHPNYIMNNLNKYKKYLFFAFFLTLTIGLAPACVFSV